jgi:hypothetical protein
VTLAFIVSPLIISRREYFSLALTTFTFAALWAIPLWEAWPTNLLTILLYGQFHIRKKVNNTDISLSVEKAKP